MKETIKRLYMPKKTKSEFGLIINEEPFSIPKILKNIQGYFIKNKHFPDEILLDIEDYLEFPGMFARSDTLGNLKDGFNFLGIKIKVKK